MKKIIITLALFTMLFSLTACPGTDGPAEGANWKTFRGGTEGVSIDFEMDAPPREINVGDPFFVMVQLNNKGEHTVAAEDYRVKLKGFSPEDFSTSADALEVFGEEDLQANTLDPDTGEVLESYEVYMQIPVDGDLSYNEDTGIAGNTAFPFFAELCYKYKTTANAKLCIKEDLTKTSDTNVCTLSGPQAVTSSGGPIQINDFKESRAGGSAVRFTFKVMEANTGGDVSRMDSDCSSEIMDEDRIYVTVNTGIPGLRCNGFLESTEDTEGFVKLSGGYRQITCTQTLDETYLGDYVKIVEITAEYDHEISKKMDVLVKPLIE